MQVRHQSLASIRSRTSSIALFCVVVKHKFRIQVSWENLTYNVEDVVIGGKVQRLYSNARDETQHN